MVVELESSNRSSPSEKPTDRPSFTELIFIAVEVGLGNFPRFLDFVCWTIELHNFTFGFYTW